MIKHYHIALVATLALASNAFAARLTVTNPGFDFTTYPSGGTNTQGYTQGARTNSAFVPVGGGSDNTAVVLGWHDEYLGGGPSDSAGVCYLSTAYWLTGNYSGIGNAVGYASYGGTLVQTITNGLQANTAYRLKVDLLARSSGLASQTNIIVQLQDAAKNDLGGTLTVVMPTANGPGSATYIVKTGTNVVQGDLRIVLGDSLQGTYSQICFDNVTLDAGQSYANPVLGFGQDADPDVIRYNGLCYVYSDNHVYKSWDMVNWYRGATVVTNAAIASSVGASSTYYNPSNQTFYYYYTVFGSTNSWIGVATNATPDGNFVDQGQLLNDAIDPYPFLNSDGSTYLYWASNGVVFVNKMIDLTHLGTGTNTQVCLAAGAEAPAVFKRNGTYYMIFSYGGANSINYQVGYGTASNPMGPWTAFPGNPIIASSGGVYGPGSGDVTTDDAGNLWFVYHQKIESQPNWNRFVCLDPLWFDDVGGLHGQATRGLAQPAPIMTITRQPQDQLLDATNSAAFTVAAQDPLRRNVSYGYKWFKSVNGTNDIQMGTNATLTVAAPLTSTNEGSYYCKVYSNAQQVAVSAPAKLAIKGLVGRWNFDGNTTDSSGGTNNGILIGSPSYVPGVGGSGQALSLNGADQAVSIPTTVWNRMTANTVTISVWQYGDLSQPQGDILFSADDSTERVILANVPYSDGFINWDAGNGVLGYDHISQTAVAPNYKGQWNHWVFTKDATAGQMSIYLNGQLWLQGSGATRTLGSPTSFHIGSGWGFDYYAGVIDDFRIYNYVLTSNQVAQLYSNTLAPAITWSTPVTISANSDVSTNGTLLAAYSLNNGGGTVNGVTFASSGGGSLGGYISLSPAGFAYSGFGGGSSAPYANLSSAYRNLIANGRGVNGAGNFTVTLTNLTAGHQYQVQVWCNDSRGFENAGNGSAAYNAVVGGGNTAQVQTCSTGVQGGVGQSTIGTFVADAGSRSFTVTGVSYQYTDTYLNAIQLRDLGTQVPASITIGVSGGQMTLSWPSAYQSWILQVQTNALNKGLGTNWVNIGPIPGTTTNVPIQPGNVSVFYRLRSP